MSIKKTVAVICGGKSAEHEVSLRSGKNVYDAIDKDKYNVIAIGIDKSGNWLFFPDGDLWENPESPENVKLRSSKLLIGFQPGNTKETFFCLDRNNPLPKIDIVFPVLHGPNGEDGTIQGLLTMANIAFVGSDTLGSANAMDKIFAKRLFNEAGIPIGPFQYFYDFQKEQIDYDKIVSELGPVVYVKPANMGSSVGITKATSKEAFSQAVEDAFLYDKKILIESQILGREIECGVLGNDNPSASKVAEIKVTTDFYNYESKYVNANALKVVIPADLSPEVESQVQHISVAAFKSLGLSGLARCDFFLTSENKVIINEVNTMPGFTSSSVYPLLWKESGVPTTEVVSRLIDFALERHKQRSIIKN